MPKGTSVAGRIQKRSKNVSQKSKVKPTETSLSKQLSELPQAEIDQKGSEGDDLCERCKSIDFEAIFNTTKNIPPLNGLPILELGTFESNPPCPVCRLFVAVRFPENWLGQRKGYHLRAFPVLNPLSEKKVKRNQSSVVLGVFHGTLLRREIYRQERDEIAHRGFIVPGAGYHFPNSLRHFYEGHQIDPARVNFNRIKEWLHHCLNQHPELCGMEERRKSTLLRLIDCDTRTIILADDDVEYFALSYVWGAQSLRSGERTRQVALKLPPTGVSQVIEDAMTVVRALGKRYLWVDKYCIDQQDHDVKAHQIRNMDRIYQDAYATIIACAGSNAEYGLPGISRVARKYQPSAFIGNQRLLSSLPLLSHALQDSVWMTRGWTYQEVTLSRRCIFFTELQVYFACKAMMCSESITRGVYDERERSNTKTTVLQAQALEPQKFVYRAYRGDSELRAWVDHIRAYTSRQLTYEDDALNAFRGLAAKSPFYSYFGLPIASSEFPEPISTSKDANIGFARGLYWLPPPHRPKRHWLCRRNTFPSWSWVGWRGQVEYGSERGELNGRQTGALIKADRECFGTRFWAEDNNGKLFSLYDLVTSCPDERLIPELSKYLILETWVIQLRFKERESTGEYIIDKHFDTAQNGEEAYPWGNVILHQDPLEQDDMTQRLITQEWDCLLLFSSQWIELKMLLHHCIIVEWHGDVAQRVGAITIHTGEGNREPMKLERRRIRLC